MKTACTAAMVALTAFCTALAHHSYAVFDVARTISLSGTVKSWEWTNPHTWLVMVVSDSRGEPVEWSIEGSSPAIYRRYGGSRDMVRAGDRVTVVVHPLRTGANGGQLESITTGDGRTLDFSKSAP